jgi:predicted transcriptional regulator
MNRALLLSVRPRFAQALLDGTKTAEIRRRFPDVPAGTTVVLYSSSPDKAVLGTMCVESLIRSTAAEIWRDYSEEIGIGEPELTEYLKGASECSVLKLIEPNRWANAVPLHELRRLLHLQPAQSFRYLNNREVAKLTALGADAEAKVVEFPVMTRTDAIVVMA